MTELKLSEAEKQFITSGVKQNIRIDGRSCLDYRNVEIETSIISNCFGSAHIRLGNCDVMAAVKVDLTNIRNRPGETANDKGTIEFFADLSANADPFFEGKGGNETANLIVSTLTEAYEQCFDFKALCVLENKYTWTINVDILILEVGSKASLFDSCAIAAKVALLNTSIPKVTVDEVGEIKLSDDLSEFTKLDPKRIPLFLTMTRIGHRFIVDTTQEEEASSLSCILFAADSAGNIVQSKKITQGNLHVDSLKDVFPRVSELAIQLHQEVESKASSQNSKINRLSGKFNVIASQEH